jgi:SAM-dependent methyltransferase
MTVRLERVLEFIDDRDLKPDSLVLDAGCGPGHFAISLANRGYRVCAIDTSEAMLDELYKNTKLFSPVHKIHAQIASIEELPFKDNSFDVICSLGVIEYLEKDEIVLSELLRVLRPGGILILSVTNLWSPAGYLDYFVESVKRQSWLLKTINTFWVRMGNDEIRPRYFKIRRHRPSQLRRKLSKCGCSIERASYFYMLPFPHPFDRLLPKLSDKLGRWMEPACDTFLGKLAEGYIVCARKQL